jgi:3-oxoacyl-[acyl-carrier protein] reductase
VAARFGRIDALVNNAARFATRPLFDLNESHFTEMMSVNVLAPLWCGREFVKIVRQRGQRGAIVNISSVSARATTANYGLYSASKAALDSLTRSMCVEWRPFGVSVNGVAPGHVRTASVQQDLDSGLLDADNIASRTPAGRIASPDEIASVVAFLLSPAAQHIDGQTLIVDGGRSSTL